METLQVTKTNAQKAFYEASFEGKELLTNLFGKEAFMKITDRVKTFEDACQVLGINAAHFTLGVPDGMSGDADAIEAFFKLTIIARALNEGWEPDWNDSNQYKWYPWFKMKAGFGFSASLYDYSYTGAIVGSRLCFKTEALANYAGQQFEDIYKAFLSL